MKKFWLFALLSFVLGPVTQVAQSECTAIDATYKTITWTRDSLGIRHQAICQDTSGNIIIPSLPAPTIPVTSVFGRTGNVAAQSGDYRLNELNNPAGATAFTYATDQNSDWTLQGTGQYHVVGGAGLVVDNGITTGIITAFDNLTFSTAGGFMEMLSDTNITMKALGSGKVRFLGGGLSAHFLIFNFPVALTADRTLNVGDANTVLPQPEAGASNNFLTALNGTTGAFSKAQPSFSNLSGTASAGQLPAGSVPLTGTTGSIGGGLLTVGTCSSGTSSVTGARSTMAVVATPGTYPGDGNYWTAVVSSNDTVTVRVCATATLTPAASTYIVRVIP